MPSPWIDGDVVMRATAGDGGAVQPLHCCAVALPVRGCRPSSSAGKSDSLPYLNLEAPPAVVVILSLLSSVVVEAMRPVRDQPRSRRGGNAVGLTADRDQDAPCLPLDIRTMIEGRGDARATAAGDRRPSATAAMVARYCGERPNFRCAPLLAANRRGNPNLSGTACMTALACLTVGHMSVFPAARNGRPPAYSPQAPAGGRSRAGTARRRPLRIFATAHSGLYLVRTEAVRDVADVRR
jgi:hypothetical protein